MWELLTGPSVSPLFAFIAVAYSYAAGHLWSESKALRRERGANKASELAEHAAYEEGLTEQSKRGVR